MNKYPVWWGCKICTCTLYENDTWKEIFKPISTNIYECLYKRLPEDSFSEKIIKLRKINNLERKDLAAKLGVHLDTIVKWEANNIYPKPENIKVICDTFSLKLNYFEDYYYTYYNNPGDKIRLWKNKNNYTYADCCRLLNISNSYLGRLINNKINLSYEIYKKLKEVGAL